MAPHFGILAWEIPWTEEPGGLHIKRVGYNLMIKQLQQKAWMKTRNPNHQTSKGLLARSKFSLTLAPIEKCISHGGKTVKTGTKFIIRDTAQ